MRESVDDRALAFAYADPPYPGLARRYYRDESSYGGEVDHRALIAELHSCGYDGWALSTSSKALRKILPLCPENAILCPWVKPNAPSPATRGAHNRWEALIVVPGRRRRPGVRDWLLAQPARFGGDLTGRKPIAFCAWLFQLLGMLPGDRLDDLFPGTGVVARAWEALGGVVGRRRWTDRIVVSSAAGDDASSRRCTMPDTSPVDDGDTLCVVPPAATTRTEPSLQLERRHVVKDVSGDTSSGAAAGSRRRTRLADCSPPSQRSEAKKR